MNQRSPHTACIIHAAPPAQCGSFSFHFIAVARGTFRESFCSSNSSNQLGLAGAQSELQTELTHSLSLLLHSFKMLPDLAGISHSDVAQVLQLYAANFSGIFLLFFLT